MYSANSRSWNSASDSSLYLKNGDGTGYLTGCVRPFAAAPSGMPPPGEVEAGPWYDDAPHATLVRAVGAVRSAPGCVACVERRRRDPAAAPSRDP